MTYILVMMEKLAQLLRNASKYILCCEKLFSFNYPLVTGTFLHARLTLKNRTTYNLPANQQRVRSDTSQHRTTHNPSRTHVHTHKDLIYIIPWTFHFNYTLLNVMQFNLFSLCVFCVLCCTILLKKCISTACCIAGCITSGVTS